MVASAPRACVQLGANAAAEILEDFGPSLGGCPTFTNSLLEVQLLAAGLAAGLHCVHYHTCTGIFDLLCTA